MRAPASLVLIGALALGGCREERELDNFEDDGEGESGGLPPDLPTGECVPRAMQFAGDCGEDEKCSYVVDPVWGPTGSCVPIAGVGQPDEPCLLSGASDTCGAGSVCWGIDSVSEVGLCIAFCNAVLVCEDESKVCVVAEDGLLALCLDPCHPLDAEACAEGWGCYDSTAGRWGCDADFSGDIGQHGSPCECVNCCDPGLICQPAGLVDGPDCMVEGSVGCCAEVCGLPMGEDPPVVCPTENETCRPYYGDEVLAGYEDVGVCVF